MNIDDKFAVYKAGELMEYGKWGAEIPYITFPTDWQVKIIPPFGGAVVRFRVRKGDVEVSVYLDCYDNLGCYGKPYWEVHPHDDDVFRCDMEDTEALLKAISESINQRSTGGQNDNK